MLRFILFIFSIIALINLVNELIKAPRYNWTNLNFGFLVISILLLIISYIISTIRWDLLIKTLLQKKISNTTLFLATLYGQALAVVSPGRIGDLYRSYLLNSDSKDDDVKYKAIVLYEYVWQVFFLGILTGIGLIFIVVHNYVKIQFFIQFFNKTEYIIGTIFVVLVISSLIYIKISSIFLRKKLGDTIDFNAVNKKMIFYSGTTTFSIWVLWGIRFWLIWSAVGVFLTFEQVVVSLSIPTMIGIISLLPGGIGLRDYSTYWILTNIFNLNVSSVIIGLFLIRIMTLVPELVIGGVSYLFLKKNDYK